MNTVMMDIKELSVKLHVSVGTLYNWASQKRIPYFKVGKKLLFDEKQIDQWLQEKQVDQKDFV